jgi:hypothetical protein
MPRRAPVSFCLCPVWRFDDVKTLTGFDFVGLLFENTDDTDPTGSVEDEPTSDNPEDVRGNRKKGKGTDRKAPASRAKGKKMQSAGDEDLLVAASNHLKVSQDSPNPPTSKPPTNQLTMIAPIAATPVALAPITIASTTIAITPTTTAPTMTIVPIAPSDEQPDQHSPQPVPSVNGNIFI